MENEFFTELEKLQNAHDIDGIENYLESTLESALKENKLELVLQSLNELIGFYRDISKYEESYKYAKALYNFIQRSELDVGSVFVQYINIANAYRAFGDNINAKKVFNQAEDIYVGHDLNYPIQFASLYNNWALVYENEGNFEIAIEKLLRARKIILLTSDKIKLATSDVNIALSYLSLSNNEKAKIYLDEADEIFKNKEDDFHYSGLLSLKGRYYYLLGDIDLAIYNYEKACSYLLMNVGQNEQYYDIRKELISCYKLKGIDPHIKGIELSKKYYESIKNDFFKSIPLRIHKYLTIGLFGLGSECYGQDDLISEDHDFDPDFIVLVSKKASKNDFNCVLEGYKSLNRHYSRFYIQGLNKKGVHYLDEYLKDFLGVENIDSLSEQSKSLITNGEIFYSGFENEFVSLRQRILKDERKEYIPNLILKTLEIDQILSYNLSRSKTRSDEDTYYLLKNHLIDRFIEYYYIVHHQFKPHEKLQMKMMSDSSIIKKWIKRVQNNDISNLLEEVSTHLLIKLEEFGIINKHYSNYIGSYRDELITYVQEYQIKQGLIKEIVSLEWEFFSQLRNIDGPVSCQSNPQYFILMREAQYYTFNNELLISYLFDLKEAKKNKYNLLAIKYGFMEESLDKNHFASIKEGLPKLSEKRLALQEEIIKVQLEEYLEYQKNNSEVTSLMRDLSSSNDLKNKASYETYLRGELSSYSEKTLFLYAKNLASLDQRNINIAELTLKYTFLLKTNEMV